MVQLRRVGADDWRLLREVRLRALLDSPQAFARTHAEEAAHGDEFWQRRASDSEVGVGGAMFVAVSPEGDTVGLVGVHRGDSAEGDCELVSMWCDPAVRGQGIGERLVGAVLDWARGIELDRVLLWVVQGNDAAQRLYERCGFVVTGETGVLASDPCAQEVRMAHLLRPESAAS